MSCVPFYLRQESAQISWAWERQSRRWQRFVRKVILHWNEWVHFPIVIARKSEVNQSLCVMCMFAFYLCCVMRGCSALSDETDEIATMWAQSQRTKNILYKLIRSNNGYFTTQMDINGATCVCVKYILSAGIIIIISMILAESFVVVAVLSKIINSIFCLSFVA